MILLLDLVIFIVVIILLLFFVTQIVFPLKNGTPLFPLFFKTDTSAAVSAAEEELEKIAELEQLDNLQEEINRRKAKLKKEE